MNSCDANKSSDNLDMQQLINALTPANQQLTSTIDDSCLADADVEDRWELENDKVEHSAFNMKLMHGIKQSRGVT